MTVSFCYMFFFREQDDEVEVELPWGMRGPREGEVAAFLAAHLATRGLTCLLVVDDLWDRCVVVLDRKSEN